LNINGTNVTGKIGLGNLPNGTSGYILQSTGSSTQWVSTNSITVDNATNSTTSNTTQNVNITESSTNDTRYLLFVDSVGDRPINTNITNSIKINPSNGNVNIIGLANLNSGLNVIANSFLFGNVGIGGFPQSYKLYVNGGASIGTITAPPSNGLRVGGDSFLVGNVGIGGNPQSYRLYVNGGASIGTTTAPPSNGLRVGGDVGIGVNPDEKLDVDGRLKIRNIPEVYGNRSLVVNSSGLVQQIRQFHGRIGFTLNPGSGGGFSYVSDSGGFSANSQINTGVIPSGRWWLIKVTGPSNIFQGKIDESVVIQLTMSSSTSIEVRSSILSANRRDDDSFQIYIIGDQNLPAWSAQNEGRTMYINYTVTVLP
jgi:hypothetical protein